MSLHVKVAKQREGYFVVTLNGKLDSITSVECEAKLASVVTGAAKVVLLDMTFLDYISSMGVRLILKTRKALEAQQARLILSSLQPQIAKVFEIARALPPQAIFASVAEADRYFDVIQRKEIEKQMNVSPGKNS
jgi:anti-anti-sigma factor